MLPMTSQNSALMMDFCEAKMKGWISSYPPRTVCLEINLPIGRALAMSRSYNPLTRAPHILSSSCVARRELMSRKFPLPSVKIVARIAGVAVTMEHLVNVPQEERDVPIAGRQRPPVSVEKIFDAMLMILAWCVKCGVLDCRTLG